MVKPKFPTFKQKPILGYPPGVGVTSDQNFLQGKKFLEFYFMGGLFYAKNPKSEIFGGAPRGPYQ